MDELRDTANELQQQWELQLPDLLSEEVILGKLTERVMHLINEGADPFFRLMYRLDIPEKQLMAVAGDVDAAQKIARMIYNRQLQKVRSREYYRNKKNNNDPDMDW